MINRRLGVRSLALLTWWAESLIKRLLLNRTPLTPPRLVELAHALTLRADDLAVLAGLPLPAPGLSQGPVRQALVGLASDLVGLSNRELARVQVLARGGSLDRRQR